MIRRFVVTVLIALAVVGVDSRVANAHAQLESSEPVANATVTTATERVAIRFDNPIALELSSLEVTDSTGKVATENQLGDLNDGRSMSVDLIDLEPGAYLVKWAATASDGHRSNGAHAFYVGAGGQDVRPAVREAKAGGEVAAAITIAQRIAEVIAFVGVAWLLALWPAQMSTASAARSDVRRRHYTVAYLAVFTAACAQIVFYLIAADSGSLLDVLRTRFGLLTAAMAFVAVLSATFTGRLPSNWSIGRSSAVLSVTALPMTASIAATSHLVQDSAGVVLAIVHTTASLLAVGMLFVLHRSSTGNIATTVVAVAAATTAGITFATNGFDLPLITLLAAAVLMTWLHVVPGARVAGAIALAAALVFAAAADPGGSSESRPVSATVRVGAYVVDAVIDPARTGDNGVHAYVSTTDRLPADVENLTVKMQPDTSTAAGDSRQLDVPLQQAGTGHFVSYGVEISSPGSWRVDIGVVDSDGSTSSASTTLQIRPEGS